MLAHSFSSHDFRAVPLPPYTPPSYIAPTSPVFGGGSLQRIYVTAIPDGGTGSLPQCLANGHVVINSSYTDGTGTHTLQPNGCTVNCNNGQWMNPPASVNQGYGDNQTNGVFVVVVTPQVTINDLFYTNPTLSLQTWSGDGVIRDTGLLGAPTNIVVNRMYARGAQAALTSTHYSGDFTLTDFLFEDLRCPSTTNGRDHGIYLSPNGVATLTNGFLHAGSFAGVRCASTDVVNCELGDMLKCRMLEGHITRVHCIAEYGNYGYPYGFNNGGIYYMDSCYGAMGFNSNNSNMIDWGSEQITTVSNNNYAYDARGTPGYQHELHIHNCVFNLYPWKTRVGLSNPGPFTQGRFIHAPQMVDQNNNPTVTTLYDISGNVIFNIDTSDTLWDGGLHAVGVNLPTNNLCVDINGSIVPPF